MKLIDTVSEVIRRKVGTGELSEGDPIDQRIEANFMAKDFEFGIELLRNKSEFLVKKIAG